MQRFAVIADSHSRIHVVVLADIFKGLATWIPPKEKTGGPFRGIGAWIIYGHLVFQSVEAAGAQMLPAATSTIK